MAKKYYVATVHLVLPADVDCEAMAADAISGALSENLLESGAILDWCYANPRAHWAIVESAGDWIADSLTSEAIKELENA